MNAPPSSRSTTPAAPRKATSTSPIRSPTPSLSTKPTAPSFIRLGHRRAPDRPRGTAGRRRRSRRRSLRPCLEKRLNHAIQDRSGNTEIGSFEPPRGNTRPSVSRLTPKAISIRPMESVLKSLSSPTRVKTLATSMVAKMAASSLAVDPASNDLYSSKRGEQQAASSPTLPSTAGSHGEFCVPLDSFGQGKFSSAQGIAIDGTSHSVYVGDTTAQEIRIFASVPVVSYSPLPSLARAPARSPPFPPAHRLRLHLRRGKFPEGTTVTLTATPTESATFAGWGSGDCEKSRTRRQVRSKNDCRQVGRGRNLKPSRSRNSPSTPHRQRNRQRHRHLSWRRIHRDRLRLHLRSRIQRRHDRHPHCHPQELGSSFAGWTGCTAEPRRASAKSNSTQRPQWKPSSSPPRVTSSRSTSAALRPHRPLRPHRSRRRSGQPRHLRQRPRQLSS